MDNKCKKCNKRNSVFKRLDTGENICLLCGVKIEYESQGIKGIYKVLKLHIKTQITHLSFQEKLLQSLKRLDLIIVKLQLNLML